jgi:hypothetical protein
MTVKAAFVKLGKIVGWTIAAVLGSVLALFVLFFVLTSPFWYELTSELAKEQVINLNKKLSADDVCIFDVGRLASVETKGKYPGYKKVSGSDMMHESSSYWSVVAIHHQEKTFDLYVVDRHVVHLVDASGCSNTQMLRIEPGGGGSDFWYAFAQ